MIKSYSLIQQLVFLAGVAQLVLGIGSLAIPGVLGWKAELAKVGPLIRQMFWTYAAYILVINLCFGLLSLVAVTELTSGTFLARAITGFIAGYWLSRVFVQFFYFDRSNFPTGLLNRLAEVGLVALFIVLSAVYSAAFCLNLIIF